MKHEPAPTGGRKVRLTRKVLLAPMDLTHTMTVEHADAQSDGCGWGHGPECLCDVVITEPMRDDDYDIAPWIEEAFTSAETDDWLPYVWDLVVGRTLLASLEDGFIHQSDVLLALDNEPLVRDLLDGLPSHAAAARHGVFRGTVMALRKYLNLRDDGPVAAGIRSNKVREHVLERHFGGGERVVDICRDLQAKGAMPVAEVTVYQWVSRERAQRAAA